MGGQLALHDDEFDDTIFKEDPEAAREEGLNKGGKKGIAQMTRITQHHLESCIWGAAVLLRGTIDAGDYKQFIFPLLFYKRLCDDFDEETQAALKESGGDAEFAQYPENHRFQVPPDSHWEKVRHTATNVGRALQEGMR